MDIVRVDPSGEQAKGRNLVDEAVERAHDWGQELGPFWIAVFDQFHGDIRRWAEEVGVDPLSDEFTAAWYVACRALKQVVEVMPAHPSLVPRLNRMADIVAAAGMWGATVDRAGDHSSAS
ncbi:MAG: hypothetical protein E6G44_00930 [Actinobacteria bacterium]|nr:MAG: hypothetical protein E6G44_00930 [Actinomycetota bacterium]